MPASENAVSINGPVFQKIRFPDKGDKILTNFILFLYKIETFMVYFFCPLRKGLFCHRILKEQFHELSTR